MAGRSHTDSVLQSSPCRLARNSRYQPLVQVRVRIALGASNRARRGEVACYVGIAGGGGDVTLHLLQDDVAKPEPNEAFRLHQLLESL